MNMLNLITELSGDLTVLALDYTGELFEYSGDVYTSVIVALLDCVLPKGIANSLSTKYAMNYFKGNLHEHKEILEDVMYHKALQSNKYRDALKDTGEHIIAIDNIGDSLMKTRQRLSTEGLYEII